MSTIFCCSVFSFSRFAFCDRICEQQGDICSRFFSGCCAGLDTKSPGLGMSITTEICHLCGVLNVFEFRLKPDHRYPHIRFTINQFIDSVHLQVSEYYTELYTNIWYSAVYLYLLHASADPCALGLQPETHSNQATASIIFAFLSFASSLGSDTTTTKEMCG